MSFRNYAVILTLTVCAFFFVPPSYGGACTLLDSPRCACNCYADMDIPGQGSFTLGTTGEMQVLLTDCADVAGIESMEMDVTKFDVDAETTPYGAMQIRLDETRPAPTSTYVANIPYQEYPATHDMYAYCTVTFEDLSGVVWRSIQPFHMRSEDVNSIFPSINEAYELVSEVEFEDVSNPGVVVATLTGANITVDH